MFSFRDYQLDDLARAAMSDGCVLAWDKGLGKSIAAFSLPLVKGARMTLLVAPGSLHQQFIDEARTKFKVTLRTLRDQADVMRDPDLRRRTLDPTYQPAAPIFWIVSYTTLGYNGGDEWPARTDQDGQPVISKKLLKIRRLHPQYRNDEEELNIGTVKNGIRCIYRPTVSTLVADLFDCVVVDEAVRMQNTVSYISTGVRQLRAKYRYVLTATPVKNYLDSMFWLAHWAVNGTVDEPTARWPYENTPEAKALFSSEHMVTERNLTQEAKEAERTGTRRQIKRRTPALCNLHRLWKLLGPVVIRRRKDATGEAIVPKILIPIRVRPGSAQQIVYQFHLNNPPEYTRAGNEMANPMASAMAQLQLLRQAALCPDSENLGNVGLSMYALRQIQSQGKADADPKKTESARKVAALAERTTFEPERDTATALLLNMIETHGSIDVEAVRAEAPSLAAKLDRYIDTEKAKNSRSWTDHNPKQAAILRIIEECLSRGEQVVVMSPFQHFSDTLYRRLRQARVSTCLLDGKMDERKRGQEARKFKKFNYSVLIGGIRSMGEGHSFEQCNNLILPSLEWAFDNNDQAIDRVHRLTSTKAVNIYCMVMENTIDVRLESLFREKGEAAQLALDGRLFTEREEQINLGELLREAVRNFDPEAPTISEQAMDDEWPGLCSRLEIAERRFREWHPPIASTTDHTRVTPQEIKAALSMLPDAPLFDATHFDKSAYAAKLKTRMTDLRDPDQAKGFLDDL